MCVFRAHVDLATSITHTHNHMHAHTHIHARIHTLQRSPGNCTSSACYITEGFYASKLSISELLKQCPLRCIQNIPQDKAANPAA